jgi:hypothetical protein
MYLVGTVYNFCCYHDSLRLRAAGGGRKWQERTPAMAAGLTEHRWSVGELLHHRVRPKPLELAKRRGTRRRGAKAPPKPPVGEPLCLSTV